MSAKDKNTNEQLEQKQFLKMRFECKALPENEDKDYFYFEGYLSTYGNIDHGRDIVARGAFDESLKELWPDLLWQHKRGEVVGVFTDIKSDEKGLFVQGKMPKEDSLVKGRVIPQMKVGSVNSMSIGYWATKVEWDDDYDVRTILKATLFEGSLVSQPMNEEAEITDMKRLEIDEVKNVKTKRDFEKLLRDSGAFSKKSAVYLASKFIEDDPSDSDDSEELKALIDNLDSLTKTLGSI